MGKQAVGKILLRILKHLACQPQSIIEFIEEGLHDKFGPSYDDSYFGCCCAVTCADVLGAEPLKVE